MAARDAARIDTVTTTDPPVTTALAVEHVLDLAIEFHEMRLYPTPLGTRIDAIVRHGTAVGPRLDGGVLPGGGDWLVVGDDGVAHVDVRATIRTHDDHTVHLTSTGRVVLDDDARARFLAGDTLTRDDMYARTAPLFETAAEPYRWLHGVVTVGLVEELSLHHIRYRVLALT